MPIMTFPDHLEKTFSVIFKTPLRKWWHPLFGFDLIEFDRRHICTPSDDVTSMEDQIVKDYGEIGVKLIRTLFDYEKKLLEG